MPTMPAWVGRTIAALIIPAIIVTGMAFSTCTYVVMQSFTQSLGDFGAFMSTFIALAVFIGSIVFAFVWTRTQGLGWFQA